MSGFSVTGHGVAGGAKLYDGESNRGELKAHVDVLANTTFAWDLTRIVDFDKGIYIEISPEVTTYVTICFIPEDWKKFI